MAAYSKPSKRLHRGFIYLDDETVTNSLSAFESGKIDEVVTKTSLAREGGASATLGVTGAQVGAGRKGSTELEEEMLRTRTRFSIFEIWMKSLSDGKAIGRFDSWGVDALRGVDVGDTVEFRADLEITPLINLWRLYLWFADQAKDQNSLFARKGEELKETKQAERNIRTFLGGGASDRLVVLAVPLGDKGPQVAMPIRLESLIGPAGRLGGQYTVVGQVDRILAKGDELPILRLTEDVTSTPLEIKTWKDAVSNFTESAAAMGVEVTQDQAVLSGPAVWLEPIAIYR